MSTRVGVYTPKGVMNEKYIWLSACSGNCQYPLVQSNVKYTFALIGLLSIVMRKSPTSFFGTILGAAVHVARLFCGGYRRIPHFTGVVPQNEYASGIKMRFLREHARPRLDLLCYIITNNIQELYVDKFARATNVSMFYVANASNEMYAPQFKVRGFTYPFWTFPSSKSEMLSLESNRSMVDLVVHSAEVDIGNVGSTPNATSVVQNDHTQRGTTKAMYESIVNLAKWVISHANEIQDNPRQLHIAQRQLQRVYSYQESISQVARMRKRRRTNVAGNELTVFFQPPSI
ncbi:hypothetical protein H257_11899 [Aphanomyces astaci]|uniref:Uncharacterized protein n=1 Tax=Aphanomyces astaci TaxID=112090 RepID=W4G2W8_APHAT|nr:hypothetical protein H257_11899 [Aphanomyces astaci]ETV73404.1 hypothetical protein H257_11899 [Aphanomyces astaci]|eukprot:XP_009837279.1 hypothetical protein H257_11899 [Aphanomyces astaci]